MPYALETDTEIVGDEKVCTLADVYAGAADLIGVYGKELRLEDGIFETLLGDKAEETDGVD